MTVYFIWKGDKIYMKRRICLLLIITLCITLFASYRANASEMLSMLHTDGNKIVNAYGTQITLRGTNLGGWLALLLKLQHQHPMKDIFRNMLLTQ